MELRFEIVELRLLEIMELRFEIVELRFERGFGLRRPSIGGVELPFMLIVGIGAFSAMGASRVRCCCCCFSPSLLLPPLGGSDSLVEVSMVGSAISGCRSEGNSLIAVDTHSRTEGIKDPSCQLLVTGGRKGRKNDPNAGADK